MIWSAAVQDVRMVLSDGPTDKLAYRKKVIGVQNGTNLVFKTFEMRRVSTLVTPTGPVGVFLDDVLKTVSSEDLPSGQFTVASPAPTDGQSLVATYYHQWFTDAEITQFLVSASEWIGFVDNFPNIPEDLRPAAKEYAAFQGYQKLASKWAAHLAETYQLYDAPDEKRFNPVTQYMSIAKQKFEIAVKLRDDVYTRKGQAGAPRSRTLSGTVRDTPPNR